MKVQLLGSIKIKMNYIYEFKEIFNENMFIFKEILLKERGRYFYIFKNDRMN